MYKSTEALQKGTELDYLDIFLPTNRLAEKKMLFIKYICIILLYESTNRLPDVRRLIYN